MWSLWELRSPGTAEAKLGPLVFIVKEEEEDNEGGGCGVGWRVGGGARPQTLQTLAHAKTHV